MEDGNMKFGVQSGHEQAYKFCMQMLLYVTTENVAKWTMQNFEITSDYNKVVCISSDRNYGQKS
jgi:hypothetical protein